MAEEMFYATGKRKTSVARVWMRSGNGQVTINRRPVEKYFDRESDRMLIMKPGKGGITINKKSIDDYVSRDSDKALIIQPLELTETLDKYDISVNVRGGGISGQAGAIRHGISRALVSVDPELRNTLKKQGLLTRDPRMKERKKYGQPGARARFQYSKR